MEARPSIDLQVRMGAPVGAKYSVAKADDRGAGRCPQPSDDWRLMQGSIRPEVFDRYLTASETKEAARDHLRAGMRLSLKRDI
jgi:hypothetical protein